LQLGEPIRLYAGKAWIVENRKYWGRYVAEALNGIGASQVALFLVTWTSGLTLAAGARGASLLVSPVLTLTLASNAYLLPQMVHYRTSNTAFLSIKRLAQKAALVLSTLLIVWSACLLLLPRAVGIRALGDSWPTARTAILPMAVVALGSILITAPAMALRAIVALRRSFYTRLAGSAMLVTGTLIGGLTFTGDAALWGWAIGTTCAAMCWWISLLRHERPQPREQAVVFEALVP
jgi:hypothetical protein